MAIVLIIPNCTVQLVMPSLEAVEIDPPQIKMRAMETVGDVVVRCAGRTIKIHKLLLTKLVGDMLPVVDGDKTVWFTTDDEVQPDATVEDQ